MWTVKASSPDSTLLSPLSRLFPIILAWFLTRIYLLLWLAYHPPNNADAELYADWAQIILTGAFPTAGNGWQYPPLYGVPVAALGLAPFHVAIALVILGLVLDALIVTFLVAASRRASATVIGVWAWILGGVAIGPLLFETLDLVPTVFSVAGLYFVVTHRLRLSGAMIGLGIASKLWPVVLLAGWRRADLRRTIVWVVSTVLVVTVVLSLIIDGAWVFLTNQGGRGLHIESVAASPWLLLEFAGQTQAIDDRFGSIDFMGSAPRAAGLVATVIGLVAIALVAWERYRGRLATLPPADISFTVLLVLVVTSRINSPQFIVWLVAVGAFALTNRESRMFTPFFLVFLAAFMTQGVIAFYDSFMQVQALPLLAHGLRVLLLVSACGLALVQVLQSRRQSAQQV